ncbi:MAG: hypothetical protein LAO78_07680 [Acidobacteriia bacterium]|nr:hypothetical protein [Terriglobia bacterium]
MKQFVFAISFVLLFLSACPIAAAQEEQKSCDFNIVGTWQSTTGGHSNPTLLRFAPNGIATVLERNSSGAGPEWQAGEKSRYKLENPKAPKGIRLTPIRPGRNAEGEATALEITKYDDGAFTTAVTVTPDVELTRWIRVDPYRYFVVLVAGRGTPGYGAPAFGMLIKSDGTQTQTEAFGLYPTQDQNVPIVVMGDISGEIRKQFEKEPGEELASMLRLEVSAGPYERALHVLKTWQRRERENTLLYNIPYLDNAVYLNQLASSLNDCAETIKLEKLTWRIDDPILSQQNLPQVPYFFIRNLRRLNKELHIKDADFYDRRQANLLPPR